MKSSKGPLNRDANCGINLTMVDGGIMENVLIENISMSGLVTPIMIRLGNQARKHEHNAPTPGVGSVKNIRLRNITAIAQSNITSTITGIPGYSAENIWLENITLTVPGGMAALSPGFVVPENEDKKPEHDIFGDTLPAFGIYLRHVAGLQLCNVSITARQRDNRPQFIFDDVLQIDSSCVSSISNIEAKNAIYIYPNPANKYLQVESAIPQQYEIYNTMGQKVYVNQEKEPSIFINTAEWQGGLYILRTENSTKQFMIIP